MSRSFSFTGSPNNQDSGIRGRSRHSFHDLPPALASSPYLSSPMRQAARSLSRDCDPNRGSSGYNPVFRHLPMTAPHASAAHYHPSPYAEPLLSSAVFGDGDFFSSKMRRDENLRTATRTILLPSEVDELVQKIVENHSNSFNDANIWEKEQAMRKSVREVPKTGNAGSKSCENRKEASGRRNVAKDDECSLASEDAVSLDDGVVFQQYPEGAGSIPDNVRPSANGGYSSNDCMDFHESHRSVPSVKLPPVTSNRSNPSLLEKELARTNSRGTIRTSFSSAYGLDSKEACVDEIQKPKKVKKKRTGRKTNGEKKKVKPIETAGDVSSTVVQSLLKSLSGAADAED